MTTVFPTPRERALHALTDPTLDLDLTGISKPECFILGYELAWQAAVQLTEDIITTINTKEAVE